MSLLRWLVPSCSLLLVPSPAAADDGLEEQVRILSRQVSILETRHDEAERVRTETRARIAALRTMREQLISLRRERLVLQEEVELLRLGVAASREQFEDYQARYRRWVRDSAVGEVYPELADADGRIFRNVMIREVTDVGIAIRHESGSARLAYDELPEELRDEFRERFQPDDAAARAALVEEEARRANSQRLAWVVLRRAELEADRKLAERKEQRRLAAEAAAAKARTAEPTQSKLRVGKLRTKKLQGGSTR